MHMEVQNCVFDKRSYTTDYKWSSKLEIDEFLRVSRRQQPACREILRRTSNFVRYSEHRNEYSHLIRGR